MGLEVELFGSDWRERELDEDDLEDDELDEIQRFYEECLLGVKRAVPCAAQWMPGPLGEDAHSLGATMGGYSTLHVLRAFARHVELYGAPPQQPPEYGSRPDDLARVYEGSATTSFPHLIEFSDSEGWYVPLDFERPVTVVLEDGTWHVGSCVRLLAELDRLEPHLSHAPDLALVREDTVRNALAHEPFAHVVWPWAVLRWLAREAVARNAILRFG